jgi:riboflavin kinase/FMN adenylyltransferase
MKHEWGVPDRGQVLSRERSAGRASPRHDYASDAGSQRAFGGDMNLLQPTYAQQYERPQIPQSRKESGDLAMLLDSASPLPSHLRSAVVALGNFDGFHRGHQAVAARAIEMARALGVSTIVATFNPHPVRYFNPTASPFALTTLDQRRRLMTNAGIDALLVLRFDLALAGATPEEFVQNWLSEAKGVVTGEDFAFGRGRAGDVRTLAMLRALRGLDSSTVAPVVADRENISSTRIRRALKAGDCISAARLLARPYAIEGRISLARRGQPMPGFTRAEMNLGSYLSPREGTYDVQITRLDGGSYPGVARLSVSTSGAPSEKYELFLPQYGRWVDSEVAEVHFVANVCADRNRLEARLSDC